MLLVFLRMSYKIDYRMIVPLVIENTLPIRAP